MVEPCLLLTGLKVNSTWSDNYDRYDYSMTVRVQWWNNAYLLTGLQVNSWWSDNYDRYNNSMIGLPS